MSIQQEFEKSYIEKFKVSKEKADFLFMRQAGNGDYESITMQVYFEWFQSGYLKAKANG